MPCYFPLQAFYQLRPDGKKDVKFSNACAELFQKGVLPSGDSNLSVPCGRCMGCRLEKSRQWALRIMHESKMYDENCFVTLTFSEESLSKMCPDGSLYKKHMQDFLKRLRRKFSDRKVRVFYCGEYGDQLGRPHYHLCLFNLDFSDKRYWKCVNGCRYYVSQCLSDLWPYGHCCIGSLTFESAAYVARYCTKKITGDLAEQHYQGRLPEFAQMSLKPGIGRFWIDKFGPTDVFPYDECISRGSKCKPPRYYDKVREQVDPEGFAKAKEARRLGGESKSSDSTYDRLATRLKCQQARFNKLVRILEK